MTKDEILQHICRFFLNRHRSKGVNDKIAQDDVRQLKLMIEVYDTKESGT